MKTIHLKCGHRILVKTWPSKLGLAKVRHHYKKFHPTRMRKMTRKSLATKRKRGLIKNRCNPTKRKTWKCEDCGYATVYHKPKYPCPQCGSKRIYTFEQWRSKPISKRHFGNPAKKSTIIYDKLLGIEARKSHGKFKGQNFFHDFKKNTDAMVVGNPDGSLTIKSSKGKRLWKKFKY